MKPAQLAKRIEELSEKLKPAPSEGIRIDFYSVTQPEQLVLVKNIELNEKYRGGWTSEAILENKDIILKGNPIIIERLIELFEFTMPRTMMLDEVEQWFFRYHFNDFLIRWLECQEHLGKWSKKDREALLRDIQIGTKIRQRNINEMIKSMEKKMTINVPYVYLPLVEDLHLHFNLLGNMRLVRFEGNLCVWFYSKSYC